MSEIDSKTITNGEEHEKALQEAARYFKVVPAPGTPEAAAFESLIERIEQYEAIHYPIANPTPEEARRFRQQQEQSSSS